MNTLVPSPAPSLDSDTDAFNTADARIHFGPLRSPEKKFHPVLTCLNTPHTRSPLRRSPRLSTPCPSSPANAIQIPIQRECTPLNLDEGIASGEEVANSLFPGSPEHHNVLQDEPPSVLVTRIMRAHGNPSPPPESPTSPLVDIGRRYSRTPSRSPPSLPDNGTDAEQRFDPISVHTPSLATDSREKQYNLLFFDSPLTPPIMTPPADSPPASPSHPPLVVNPSVDDLLLLIPGSEYPSACGEPSRFASSNSISDPEKLENSNIIEETPTATCTNLPENLSSDTAEAILPSGGSSMISTRLGSPPVLLIDDGQQSLSTSEMVTDEERRDSSCTDKTNGSSKKEDDATEESIPLEDTTSSSNSKVEPTSSRDPQSPNRELGPLSPTLSSASGLAHVLPLSPKPSSPKGIDVPQDNVSGAPAIAETDPLPPPQPPPLFPQLRKTPTPETPVHVTRPFRFSSPTRPCAPQTPGKSRLLPAALDDPQRTPARRILIADAIAQGHASPHKDTSFVGKIPVLKISSTDSPARRVNAVQAPTTGLRLGSSSRIGSPMKHRTAESHPSRVSSCNNEDISSDQTAKDSRSKSQIAGPSSATATSNPRPLPFPIVASRAAPSQSALETKPTMGDVRMSSPVKSDPPSIPSPAKSSLKQTTSRIPRGVKPYARPPVPGDRQDKPTSVSVEKARATPVSANLSTRNGTTFDGAIPNSETILYGKSASSSSLKRKRGVETVAPPPKPRPVVLLRQVPRIIPSVDVKVSHTRPGIARSTIVKERVQQIRKVPTIQPTQPTQQGSDSDVPETPDADTSDGATAPKLQDIPDKVRSPSPPGQQDQTTSLVAEPPARRRTTRTRKSTQPAAITDDVFTETAPLQPRRRANKAQSFGDGVFSGMSAVALKAITSSNTLRNQRYVAAKLETEVVRKPGARPESPAVKIKPTLQRQREAKGKERRERADRRAKRSDGSVEEGQSDTDKQSDIDDGSAADVDSDWDDLNSSPLRKRHKRAPGDEEDYETPLRPGVGQEDEDEVVEKRRVKWDKGLFTTIYLDEVAVGSRPPPKENIATKGCLAATAKAVSLDTLGNLPDADSPLTELVEENVVVKKFVYDNDVEPVQEIVVVKNTRLRSKKGKD